MPRSKLELLRPCISAYTTPPSYSQAWPVEVVAVDDGRGSNTNDHRFGCTDTTPLTKTLGCAARTSPDPLTWWTSVKTPASVMVGHRM